MSIDYYIAIHSADWPTPSVLNRCMAEAKYPVRLVGLPALTLDQPLGEMPGSAGFAVMFENQRVDLEAAITRLGPKTPYALTFRLPTHEAEGDTLPDGTSYTLRMGNDVAGLVPSDLSHDLRDIGVPSPDYKDGDYVVTFSFRSDVAQYRAGWFLMAGLIKCARGFGFEFQQGSFGTDDFAAGLAREAADPDYWK